MKNNQAKKYFDNKQFDKAVEVFESIKDLPEQLVPNLAKCYYYNKQATNAIRILEQAASISPLDYYTSIDLALYHNAIGNHQYSFQIYKKLLEEKEDVKVKFNIGWHYLRNNEFKKGFDNLQYGMHCDVWGHEHIYLKQGILNPKDKWNGEYVDHLLYILEGGIGDNIIFLRWANHLSTKCNKLTILAEDSLLRLFINSGYDCVSVSKIKNIEYDKYCPAMSLPAITDDISFPQDKVQFPYINSFSERFISNQIDYIANGKLKIGIRWAGNPEFEHDQFRTVPKEELLKLQKYGQLFSLQLEDDDERLPNCKHIIKDWQDTYSVFSSLDVLVTSCTSTAHLAGAMGIKTIVLVPLVPYFTWASDEMRWYPTENVTVIRQTEYNSWNSAIEKLNYELQRLCNI